MTPSEAIGLVATHAQSEDEPPPRPSSGTLPARYHLSGKLGAGGMGEVLLASDQQIGRDVAIKRMLGALSKSLEPRFLREAKIQGRLDHPAVVPVYELANDSEGRPFFVMKRLTGTTLAEVVADRASKPRFSRQKLLRAFADVCLAIEFAHSRGIVHRDLKPANIMLGDFGEVYVLDWGIARILDEADDVIAATARPSRPEMTELGAVLGTPGYIAPEQLHGVPPDGRTDVYALGCILFEILAGQALAPRGRAVPDAEVDARPSSRAPDREIPPELDTLCVEATRVEPDDRLPTARVLAERIEHFLDGDRDMALRKSLAAAHVTTAHAALASGDGEAERATAMREAGRAIALDPTGSDAAELVGRLMLEPPRVVPAEVEDRLAQVEDDIARGRGRLVSVISLSFLGFIPILAWMGITDVPVVIVFALAVVANGLFALLVSRRKQRTSIIELHLTAVFNAMVTAIMARMFTPFLVAPGIAAVSVMMFLADPRMRAKFLVPLTLVAVLLPWVLELSGVWSRTVSELAGNLVLHAPAVNVELPTTEIALALYVGTLIAMSAIVAKRLADRRHASTRSVELQAWHLRQLVRR